MRPMSKREDLLRHLEIQARTLAAQVALAWLDDSKTDMLLPEISRSADGYGRNARPTKCLAATQLTPPST
jgi:hypothetical protein